MNQNQALMQVGGKDHALSLFGKLNKDMSGLQKESYIKALGAAFINSCRKNPKLYQCTRASMVGALMFCAESGLMPDTPMQECHLVPFKREVVWIPGFRGLQKLCRQSGLINTIEARVVREGDDFEYQYGTDPFIKHKENGSQGDITHAYSIVRLSSGQAHFEVMDADQLDRIRRSSPGRDQDPWKLHPEEMCRKSVFKRHSKWLPVSIEQLMVAVMADNQQETGEPQTALSDRIPEEFQVVEDEPESKADALAEELKAKQDAKPKKKRGRPKKKAAPPKEAAPEPPQPEPEPPKPEPLTVKQVTAFMFEHREKIPKKFLAKYSTEELEQYTQVGLQDIMEEAEGYVKEEGTEEPPVEGTEGQSL